MGSIIKIWQKGHYNIQIHCLKLKMPIESIRIKQK